ncbi:unnamed protein product [Vitrella brassicaformis CCMP3155]|uniref:Uncharacterized protein n=2 Tax=Vitrella brassicaformis TaxID=1169539 RepID=A0A0G4ENU1_VITBC|nr:unnamed protein product [Vitrella brassicaformis CCMP3155]|eukprot:CEL99283.1 unnamed protein product [Vitrella brassicaformis CCMP3155]
MRLWNLGVAAFDIVPLVLLCVALKSDEWLRQHEFGYVMDSKFASGFLASGVVLLLMSICCNVYTSYTEDMRVVALSFAGAIFHLCVSLVMFLATATFFSLGLIITWFIPCLPQHWDLPEFYHTVVTSGFFCTAHGGIEEAAGARIDLQRLAQPDADDVPDVDTKGKSSGEAAGAAAIASIYIVLYLIGKFLAWVYHLDWTQPALLLVRPCKWLANVFFVTGFIFWLVFAAAEVKTDGGPSKIEMGEASRIAVAGIALTMASLAVEYWQLRSKGKPVIDVSKLDEEVLDQSANE